MYLHYLRNAGRQLKRSPFTAEMNIVSLALGFTCFFAAIAVNAYWSLSDSVLDGSKSIYVLTQEYGEGSQRTGFRPRVTAPIARYLQSDFPTLAAVARVGNKRRWTVTWGSQKLHLTGARADAALVDVFDFDVVAGNLETALAGPDNVVMTSRAAKRLFGDRNPIGLNILVGEDFSPVVRAVVALPDGPTHFGPDEEASGYFDFLYAWPDESGQPEWWLSIGPVTYVRFDPTVSSMTPEILRSELDAFMARHLPPDQANMAVTQLDLIPLSQLPTRTLDLALFESRADSLSITWILNLLGVMVLAVAGLNYANLATAQAALGIKQMGMRKVLGATRLQVFQQYWVESLAQSVVAAVLAVCALLLLAPAVQRETGIDLLLGLSERLTHWPLFLVIVVVVATLSCLLPAVRMMQIEPIQALRHGAVAPFSRFVASGLVVFQFAVTCTLVTLLIVVQLQNNHVQSSALGSDPRSLLILTDDDSRALGYKSIAEALREERRVEGATSMDFLPWSNHENFLRVSREETGVDGVQQVFLNQVGYRYFSTFGTQLLAGRTFSEERGDTETSSLSDAAAIGDPVEIVVDLTLIRLLGFDTAEDALGADLYLSREFRQTLDMNPVMTIVGVVETRPLVLSASGTRANLYLLNDAPYFYPVVKLADGGSPAAVRAVSEAVQSRRPNAMVRYELFDEAFGRGFAPVDRFTKAVRLLSVLAIAIAVLGLVGMAIFKTHRRRHEIGVRKTMGASSYQVAVLILRDFSIPVVAGCLLSLPFAYWATQAYLSGFIDAIDVSVLPWLIAVVGCVLLSWLAAGGQAYSAARQLPSDVLRSE